MQNHIKKFNLYIKENFDSYRYSNSYGNGLGKKYKGAAIMEIGVLADDDDWVQVSYAGNGIDIIFSDEDFDGIEMTDEGYFKIFKAAIELGADHNWLYSIEDDSMIHLNSFNPQFISRVELVRQGIDRSKH